MAQGLLKIPNMVDPIIIYLLKNPDAATQQKVEKAVRARGLLREGVEMLHHLGIYEGGGDSGCDFSEEGCKKPETKPGICRSYDQCKKKHEVHSHLLGGWQLIHQEESPFCPSCGSNEIAEDKGGFLEIGEWDGKNYEEELNIIGRRCKSCGKRFWTEG